MATDPLDQIFVKSEQIAEEQKAILVKLIFPYASIDPVTGNVNFKRTSDDLSAKQKILLYLLCRLALSTRPDAPLNATVAPIEIEKATLLAGGTVRPTLMDLVKKKIVVKSGEGYSVPSAQLHRATDILEPGGNMEEK